MPPNRERLRLGNNNFTQRLEYDQKTKTKRAFQELHDRKDPFLILGNVLIPFNAEREMRGSLYLPVQYQAGAGR